DMGRLRRSNHRLAAMKSGEVSHKACRASADIGIAQMRGPQAADCVSQSFGLERKRPLMRIAKVGDEQARLVRCRRQQRLQRQVKLTQQWIARAAHGRPRRKMAAAARVRASFAGRPPTRIMAVTLIGLTAMRSDGTDRSTAEYGISSSSNVAPKKGA